VLRWKEKERERESEKKSLRVELGRMTASEAVKNWN
jgi:hypothetical protein